MIRVQGRRRKSGEVPIYQAREDRVGEVRWHLVANVPPDSQELNELPLLEFVTGGAHVNHGQCVALTGIIGTPAMDALRDRL